MARSLCLTLDFLKLTQLRDLLAGLGDFERFAATLGSGRAGDDFLVHPEIGLEVERFTGIPFLLANQGGNEFLSKECGFALFQWKQFSAVRSFGAVGSELQDFGGNGEQGFAMEQREEIAIKGGVNLEAVASVLFHVRVDELRHQAFALERLTEALGEGSGRTEEAGFFLRLEWHEKFLW